MDDAGDPGPSGQSSQSVQLLSKEKRPRSTDLDLFSQESSKLAAKQRNKKRARFTQSNVSQVEERLLSIISEPTTAQNQPQPIPHDPKPYVPNDDDEMYYFALSIVPALTKLNEKARREARIAIDTLIGKLQDSGRPVTIDCHNYV